MGVEIVAIGVSLGGQKALRQLLAGLPAGFPLPLVIAQHRGEEREELASFLQQYSALPVREPEDKEPILPGRVYLAPAGYHLLVEEGAFALSTAAPVNCARPAIDLLFESLAEGYGPRALALVLTGNSADGARGASQIRALGGQVAVQDPQSAEAPAMPRAALEAVPEARVLPLPQLIAWLAGLGGKGGAP
jgi:two-component system chemotaxis response regulator CheB